MHALLGFNVINFPIIGRPVAVICLTLYLYMLFKPRRIPTERQYLVALKSGLIKLHQIKNPSNDAILMSLSVDGESIEYVKNPSEDMKMAAVKQSGLALDLIENPSDAIILQAIKTSSEIVFDTLDGRYNSTVTNYLESVKPGLSFEIGNIKALTEDKTDRLNMLLASLEKNDTAIALPDLAL